MGDVIRGDFGKKEFTKKENEENMNDRIFGKVDEVKGIINFNQDAFLDKIDVRMPDKEFVLRIGKDKLEEVIKAAKQLIGFTIGSWQHTSDQIEGKGKEEMIALFAAADREEIRKQPTLYIRALAKIME